LLNREGRKAAFRCVTRMEIEDEEQTVLATVWFKDAVHVES